MPGSWNRSLELLPVLPYAPVSPHLLQGCPGAAPRLQLLQKKLLLVPVRPDHTDREHGESSQQSLHVVLVTVFFKTWGEQDKIRLQ